MVFNLYAIEGFKQEIASMLGINEGTSKSQLSHAGKCCKDRLTSFKNYSMEPNKLETVQRAIEF
jgi:RNA polymerase sigma-70 factor (ECF subfamily)